MRIGIVGAGIFGTAAALELCARGHQVTIFDQGKVPYERASSTDVSKTIRRLYGTNATYVELAERAGEQWRVWNERLGGRIYFPVGQLHIVRHFGPGTRYSDGWEFLKNRGAALEVLSVREARERFPQFAYRDGDVCLFDPWAGYLASGAALAGLIDLARARGVVVRAGSRVSQVTEDATHARIIRESEVLRFDRIVVATGPWLGQLAPAIAPYLRPTLQEMVFIVPADPAPFQPGLMPAWGIDPDDEGWYGHPLLAEGFVKVANDLRGQTVEPDAARQVSPAFVEAARAFVAQRIPGLANGRIVGSKACLYENTPDRDFIVDWAPGCERILLAGGGSGHGFKFGGSIGPLIADAVEDRDNSLGRLFRIGRRFR